MKLQVVVTDSDLGEDDVEARALGEDVDIHFANVKSRDELIEAASGADGLLVQWATIDSTVLRALPRLRAIVRFGVGLDNIDLDAAKDAGVAVSNVPDYCIDEVASHATSMIVASARRLGDYQNAARHGEWAGQSVSPPRPSNDDPVGIAGFGRIGKAVAEKLLSLGHPVHAYDPFLTTTNLPVVIESDMRSLAKSVNHLTLHMPATIETTRICDANVLALLGADGHLVNTSRGQLIDEIALLDSLNQGQLRWASLDVFNTEPPVGGTSQALAQHPHVTATPHVAYLSTASKIRLRELAGERLSTLLRAENHGLS